MDYNRWTEMQNQAPQNPNTPPVDSYSHHLYATHYSFHYSLHHSQHPNPNPNPQVPIDPLKIHEPHYSIGLDRGLRPPGVDPYASVSSAAHSHSGVYEAYDRRAAYAHLQTVDAGAVAVPSGYYQDPNVVNAVQNWAAMEVVRHFGSTPSATYHATFINAKVHNDQGVTIPPNGTEQLVPAHANSTLWTNSIVQPHGKGIWKRGPKKTKIVQSAWCEVCRVDCNSKDVLDQHKLGKKHKKNLEKLKEATAPPPVASRMADNPVIGPPENPNKGKAASVQNSRKKAAEPVEDLETKRRKILEVGAAADAVRMCTVCNVVCNSETVFRYHLAGQKHAAMMKKHAGGIGAATTA